MPLVRLPVQLNDWSLRACDYCHLEKLHNLESLPPDGYSVACFPHKIRGASAGWTRAVAILPQ